MVISINFLGSNPVEATPGIVSRQAFRVPNNQAFHLPVLRQGEGRPIRSTVGNSHPQVKSTRRFCVLGFGVGGTSIVKGSQEVLNNKIGGWAGAAHVVWPQASYKAHSLILCNTIVKSRCILTISLGVPLPGAQGSQEPGLGSQEPSSMEWKECTASCHAVADSWPQLRRPAASPPKAYTGSCSAVVRGSFWIPRQNSKCRAM